MIQHELTDGKWWFIHARGTGHKPEHPDALYHLPGGKVACRHQLVKAFPSLKPSERDVDCAPPATKPIPGAAEAQDMHAQGLPVAQIAYRMGRHKHTIERMLGLA